MRKVTVQEWAEALLSGNYVQGRNYLQTEDGKNCCLGVLCEIAGLRFEPNYEVEPDRFADVYRTTEDDDVNWYFNDQVDGIIGNLIADPENLPIGHLYTTIDDSDFSEVNDYGGSFESIAKILRGELTFDEWHSSDNGQGDLL